MHFGALRVALPGHRPPWLHRPLQKKADQLRAGRHAETIDVANRDAHGIARPAGASGCRAGKILRSPKKKSVLALRLSP
jgi:hypothetical protein